MLLVIQISLMIAVWRKGWKAWALVPLGAGFLISVLLSGVVASLGGNPTSLWPFSLLLDLVAIAVLSAMSRRVPQRATLNTAQPVESVAETSAPPVGDTVLSH